MTITRTLVALFAIGLASPAIAAASHGRDAIAGRGTAPAATVSTHACPGVADRDGKVRCQCQPAKDEGKASRWTPEPIQDYGG